MPHLCERQNNITVRACCQLVALLNDTQKVSLCHPSLTQIELNATTTASLHRAMLLTEPPLEAEDHFTFIVGMLLLLLIALGCTFIMSKVAKPKMAVRYEHSSNYDLLLWMAMSRSRRASVLVLLRGITCRRDRPSTYDPPLSVVSSNVPLLPSYQSATTIPSPTVLIPPPPYSEIRSVDTIETVD